MAETETADAVRQRCGTPTWSSRLPDGTCLLYIDRHLVHEVTSPQAFEGLRLAGRKLRRPDATIAVVDHNIATEDRRSGDQGGGEPHPGGDAGAERGRVRRAVFPGAGCAPGHRAHYRAGAGDQPAGHDDRVRRSPYLDAWRDGGAGVRDRHQRGGARDGDADAAAEAGEEHAGAGGRQAAGGLHGQGHRAGDHRAGSARRAARAM